MEFNKNYSLKTERLHLNTAEVKDADAITSFYTENKKHFQKFSPIFNAKFYTESYQINIIEEQQKVSDPGKMKNVCFWIYKKTSNRIIGYVKLSEIVRGFFQSCFLSYAIAKRFQNFGYATEAVNSIVDFAFFRLNLHRIEANVIPENKNSIKVLQKCNFIAEGISKKYLFINGKWQDHIHFVIINDNFSYDEKLK